MLGAGRAYSALDASNRLVNQKNMPAVAAVGAFTAANPLHQSGTSKTILVDANTIQFGGQQVNYNSGSVTPGIYSTFYVYADDADYSGGAVTYVQTLNYYQAVGADGRVCFGKITTSSGGGGQGGDTCFSPNTLVVTRRGKVALKDIVPFKDEVKTARGTWRNVLFVPGSFYKGPALDMGDGEIVTPGHSFLSDYTWKKAKELGIFKEVDYDGVILNLFVEADLDDDGSAWDTEHSYKLGNGRFVHNTLPTG